MTFDILSVLAFWPEFIAGLRLTILLSLAAAVIGMIAASALVILSLVGGALGRSVVTLWLVIVRGAPFIALVYTVHYLIPLSGWRAPPIFSGIVALSMFCSAYYAEVIRATIQSLPKGQWESARAIGMGCVASVWIVVIPQLWRPAIPSLLGNTITMLKESSVLAVLTVSELTYRGLVIQGQTFAPFEVFIVTAALYWMVTLAMGRAAARAEQLWLSPGGAEADLSPIGRRYLTLRR